MDLKLLAVVFLITEAHPQESWRRRRRQRRRTRRRKQHSFAVREAHSTSDGCGLPLWQKDAFGVTRDWSVIADGPSLVSPDTWLRWDGTPAAGHLYAFGTKGYMNWRAPTFIRGHGDSEPRRAAPQGTGTVMVLLPAASAATIDAESLAATAGEKSIAELEVDPRPCVSLGEVQLQVHATKQYVTVDQTGRLQASRRTCRNGAPDCTFDRFRVGPGVFALRSRLTGHFVRFEGSHHPSGAALSHLGAKPPFARPKAPRALLSSDDWPRVCPLKAGRGTERVPRDWEYNASTYEPLIRRSLRPWHEGNISATMLDFGFDRSMFGASARRDGKPASHHVSIVGGVPRIKSNDVYRKSLLVDMLHTVCGLVELPDVEFLISLWDHPKVPQQNVEPVVRALRFQSSRILA